MFIRIDVLKIFAIFTGKHLCWSLFLLKLQAFSCGHFKIFKSSFFIEHFWWLLLKSHSDWYLEVFGKVHIHTSTAVTSKGLAFVAFYKYIFLLLSFLLITTVTVGLIISVGKICHSKCT